MSKSAREDRTWNYTGTFTLALPEQAEAIQKHIVDGCRCYGCEANRRWLKQLNEKKDNKA